MTIHETLYFGNDSDEELDTRSLRLLVVLNRARATRGRTREHLEAQARADDWYRQSLAEIDRRRAARRP
jgi:hypothetical protein